jgi:predicted secreted hydrolase
VCLAFAAGFAAAAPASAADWRAVETPLTLDLPRDHGAHPDFRTEWWYVTGTVRDAGGRVFGYQLTFFRQGLDPGPPSPDASALRARQVVAAHLAVADVDTGSFVHAERVRRAAAGLAGFATDDLEVWLEDWEMSRAADGRITLQAQDLEAGVGLELGLESVRPLVRHGDGGVSAKGAQPGNASAYLSWTRLTTRGVLVIGERTFEVTGESWLDHEWGSTQLGAEVVGWDWLGLRLDDGRDLMVYRLRRGDGSTDPHSAGTVVGLDGGVTLLDASAFTFEPRTTWRSPTTGGTYPAVVGVRVPAAGLDLEVTPLVPGAELDGRASTGVVYWEGPVRVEGTTTGSGYMELTGYAGSLRGRL